MSQKADPLVKATYFMPDYSVIMNVWMFDIDSFYKNLVARVFSDGAYRNENLSV